MMSKRVNGSIRALEENAVEEQIDRLVAVIGNPETSDEVRRRAQKTLDYLKAGESLAYRMQRNSERGNGLKGARR